MAGHRLHSARAPAEESNSSGHSAFGLFDRAAGPEPGLYAVRADHTALVRPKNGRDYRAPNWAPDGKAIVYSHRDSEWWPNYPTNSDRSDAHPLLSDPKHFGIDPTWSPDGQW